jgi:hypothetical protein
MKYENLTKGTIADREQPEIVTTDNTGEYVKKEDVVKEYQKIHKGIVSCIEEDYVEKINNLPTKTIPDSEEEDIKKLCAYIDYELPELWDEVCEISVHLQEKYNFCTNDIKNEALKELDK